MTITRPWKILGACLLLLGIAFAVAPSCTDGSQTIVSNNTSFGFNGPAWGWTDRAVTVNDQCLYLRTGTTYHNRTTFAEEQGLWDLTVPNYCYPTYSVYMQDAVYSGYPVKFWNIVTGALIDASGKCRASLAVDSRYDSCTAEPCCGPAQELGAAVHS